MSGPLFPSPPPGLAPRDQLSPAEQEEMYQLLAHHFAGVTRDCFAEDLRGKNWVLRIRSQGQLVGFSTLLVVPRPAQGEELLVVYSGDTIMSPAAWSSPSLARRWIAAVNYLRSLSPGLRCYWLLLTSGFRTYRFLPVFWHGFYPRHDVPTPARLQHLLEALAEAQYGPAFHRAEGIVRFVAPQRLRDSLALLPPGRLADPHIAYFLRRNPGHAAGDELVCLTEICAANLTPAGRRMAASG